MFFNNFLFLFKLTIEIKIDDEINLIIDSIITTLNLNNEKKAFNHCCNDENMTKLELHSSINSIIGKWLLK